MRLDRLGRALAPRQRDSIEDLAHENMRLGGGQPVGDQAVVDAQPEQGPGIARRLEFDEDAADHAFLTLEDDRIDRVSRMRTGVTTKGFYVGRWSPSAARG